MTFIEVCLVFSSGNLFYLTLRRRQGKVAVVHGEREDFVSASSEKEFSEKLAGKKKIGF